MWSHNWIVIGFQCHKSIPLFSCYPPFHSNKISRNDSFEFIMLNLLVRENKQGIDRNTI